MDSKRESLDRYIASVQTALSASGASPELNVNELASVFDPWETGEPPAHCAIRIRAHRLVSALDTTSLDH